MKFVSSAAFSAIPRNLNWLLLLAAAVFLYLKLFLLPCTPILLTGDQVYFWSAAQRMLEGQRIYQDFFQFTPPGTNLIFLALFKLFGLRIWVTNATVLVLGLALSWLCFSLSLSLMKRSFAILTTAAFLLFVYGKTLNATHHWFSVLAILAAVKIGFGKSTLPRLFFTGALLGMASFFTQTHGAVALLAFAVFLLLQHTRSDQPILDLLRQQASLFSGFVIALSALSAYFLATAGIQRLWYFQVTYVHHYLVYRVPGEFLTLPNSLILHSPTKLLSYLIVLAALLTCPIALAKCWRNRNNPQFPFHQITLLALVGLFLLAELSLHPDWTRFYAVLLPTLILFLWLLLNALTPHPRLILLLAAVTPLLALHQIRFFYRTQSARVHLPGGDATTTPINYAVVQWLATHTQPGQFFFRAQWPGDYLPLHLRNPVFVDEVVPREETRPEDVSLVIQQLQSKPVQYVLWSSTALDSIDPARNHLAPLQLYLHTAYHRALIFPDGEELFERNEPTPR